MPKRKQYGPPLGEANPDALIRQPVQGNPAVHIQPLTFKSPKVQLTQQEEGIAKAMQVAIKLAFPEIVLNVITAPFKKWMARTVLVNAAAPAIQLDVPYIQNRKAILILNPTANVLWIGHDNPAVNRGLVVPANNGSISMPLRSDEARVWGIFAAGGANQSVCVVTFYD